MARSTLIVLSLFLAATIQAVPPLRTIEVTPGNESENEFSVVLSGRGESRSMIVFAPPQMNGDCSPELATTELRANDGKLIYSQTVNLGSAKAEFEIRGEIGDPAHTLTIWINYICPEGHSRDGARYVFASLEWEKSGRMR
jgi:hypothetical protein